jgi:hypothetical protein
MFVSCGCRKVGTVVQKKRNSETILDGVLQISLRVDFTSPEEREAYPRLRREFLHPLEG